MANDSGRKRRGFGLWAWRGLQLLAALALLVIGALLYFGIPRNAADAVGPTQRGGVCCGVPR